MIDAKETKLEGFYLVENFLEEVEASKLIQQLEEGEWKANRDGSLRVQVFGPWHDQFYNIKPDALITPLPSYSYPLIERIQSYQKEHLPWLPEIRTFGIDRYTELFISEYKPNDTLPFHIDHRKTYGEIIYGISLLSCCTLTFRRLDEYHHISIPPNSLYFMSGKSRHTFCHGISTPCADSRISLTFRTINYLPY